MTNRIWQDAEMFHDLLAAKGVNSSLSRSTNRHGDHSAYLDLGPFRIRFSDHDCNTDFRVGEIQWFGDVTEEKVKEFLEEWRKKADEAARRSEQAKLLAQQEAVQRAAAYHANLDLAATNDALLAERGFAGLTGTHRKTILKKIRKGLI